MTYQVGQHLPPLERTINLVDMVAYAGATWDWYKLHYDPDAVRENGLPGPIVDGQVFGALLVEQIQDWLGPRCFVQELEFSFRNLVFAGETVRCEATISEVLDNAILLDQRVTVVDSEGQIVKIAAEPAKAKVLLGTSDGPGG